MSIIDLPDEPPLPLNAPMLFSVMKSGYSLPELYLILKPFNQVQIELSLTVRGRRPTPETLVDFLMMQGFIKPYLVN